LVFIFIKDIGYKIKGCQAAWWRVWGPELQKNAVRPWAGARAGVHAL